MINIIIVKKLKVGEYKNKLFVKTDFFDYIIIISTRKKTSSLDAKLALNHLN